MQARIAELEAQLGKRKRAPRKADPERQRRAQFRLDAQRRKRLGQYINRYYC
jgi:hypothetical protein